MSVAPPARLPRGFREIWFALREADELLSRAELSRRLGVSTHTLQRILVDGDVPDLAAESSTRLARSWARSVARLAHGLGHDPRRWVEAVGIAWDDDVRRACESTIRQLRDSRARTSPAVAGPPSPDPLERIKSETTRGQAAIVRLGTPDLRPFVDTLPALGESFFDEYARRLLQAVDPRWNTHAVRGAAANLVEGLTSDDPSLDLAIGLFETAHLRSRGLEFLPIPGWRIAFSAVWITRDDAPGSVPNWNELSSSEPRRYVVSECDPGWSIVRGTWGVPTERIVSRRADSPEELAEDALGEMRRHPAAEVVLVADEETCRRALDALERHHGYAREFRAAPVAASNGERPRFPLAIALRADSPSWVELLKYAAHEELFGAARSVTARLYADLLGVAARSFGSFGGRFPAQLPTNLCAEPFAEADETFQRELSRQLVASLRSDLGDASLRDASVDDTWETVVRLARAVVPEAWRTMIDRIAWVTKRGEVEGTPVAFRPFHTYCHSCSGSLREIPGPSHLYCRYCSDEEGRLLPREKVLPLIAEWMQGWQGVISDEEATERAERFMSAMPAWSRE